MTSRTRIVLLGGGGILVAGLIAGGVAYVQGGFPTFGAVSSGPDTLRYVPADASLVAYANVRDVMASSFRDHLQSLNLGLDGQREFREQTGVDVARDIDSVVAGLVPQGETSAGLVLLSGRFDTDRLASLAQQRGGTVDEYAGRRLFTQPSGDTELSMAFVEPGVLVLGSTSLVRRSLDLSAGGDARDVTSNDRLMGLMTHVDRTDNAWALARFENIGAIPYIPDEVASRIPPIAALAFGGRVNGGIRATLTLEGRDAQASQDLHAIVQGFVALAQLQTGAHPALQGWLDSFRLIQAGNAVTLVFDLPPEVLGLVAPGSGDAPR